MIMLPIAVFLMLLSLFAGIRNIIVWNASDKAVNRIRLINLREIYEGRDPDYSLYERLDIRGIVWLKRIFQIGKWESKDFFPWLY